MGYNDDFSMPPEEVERVLREVRRNYQRQRVTEIAQALLAFAAGLGAIVALIYYWRTH